MVPEPWLSSGLAWPRQEQWPEEVIYSQVLGWCRLEVGFGWRLLACCAFCWKAFSLNTSDRWPGLSIMWRYVLNLPWWSGECHAVRRLSKRGWKIHHLRSRGEPSAPRTFWGAQVRASTGSILAAVPLELRCRLCELWPLVSQQASRLQSSISDETFSAC